MRDNRNITKATAAAAAAALAASGIGIAVASSPLAKADEVEDTTAVQDSSIELQAAGDDSSETGTTGGTTGGTTTGTESGSTGTTTGGTTSSGTPETIVTGNGGVEIGNGTRVAGAPVASMSAGSSLSSGTQVFTGYQSGIDGANSTNQVTFTCEQKGAAKKIGQGFKKFVIKMSNPTKNSYSTSSSIPKEARDDVRLNKNQVVVKMQKKDGSISTVDPSYYEVNYIENDPSNGIFVEFKEEFLGKTTDAGTTAVMPYDGETYFVEATIKFTDSAAAKEKDPNLILFDMKGTDGNPGLLSYYQRTDGNADIPISMVCTTETNSQWEANADYPVDSTAFSDKREESLAAHDLYMRNPVLGVTWDCNPSHANVFGTITYNVHVKNLNSATTAKGLKIEDVELPNMGLAGLFIFPQNVRVTLNGTTYPLDANSIKVDNNPTTATAGKISIDCEGLTLTNKEGAAPDEAIISYDIVLGNTEMRQNKEELKKLLSLETGVGVAQRRGTVTALNAYVSASTSPEDNTNSMHASLLYPKSVEHEAEIGTPTISAGQKSHVKVTFKAVSNDPSKDAETELQAPYFDIVDPAIGTLDPDSVTLSIPALGIDKVKYRKGNLLADASGNPVTPHCGDNIILEYDVSAPAKWSQNVSDGITPTITLKAQNLQRDYTSDSNKVTVGVAIPEITPGVSVSNTTPSAPSMEEGVEPITVTATFRETDTHANATGMVFTIAESFENVDPCSARFEDIKLNGAPLSASQYSISGNTLTIKNGLIEAGKTATVTYVVHIPAGFYNNGYSDSIVATVSKDMSAAASNLPEGFTRNARTQFTVQTPKLHLNTNLSIPVVSTPKDEATTDPSNPGGATEPAAHDDAPAGDETITAESKVVSVSDTVDLTTEFYELNDDKDNPQPAAIGRDFKVNIGIDDIEAKNSSGKFTTFSPAQLGITFCDVEDMKVVSGETDLTDKFDISLDASKSLIEVKGKETLDAPEAPVKLVYTMKCGSDSAENYDQLAGKEITVSSKFAVSNLKDPITSDASVQIADAELSVTKTAEKSEIKLGDTDKYTITVRNDKEDELGDDSVARTVTIEDNLDDAAAVFGYRIDPDTLKVELDGKDITEDSDTYILWAPENVGFELTVSDDLAKKKDLVVTYDTTTMLVSADAYDETLGNVVIASAANSKPAVGYATVDYKGVALTETPSDVTGGTFDDMDDNEMARHGGMSETGDVIPYVIGGVIALAVVGGAVILVVRRRNR